MSWPIQAPSNTQKLSQANLCQGPWVSARCQQRPSRTGYSYRQKLSELKGENVYWIISKEQHDSQEESGRWEDPKKALPTQPNFWGRKKKTTPLLYRNYETAFELLPRNELQAKMSVMSPGSLMAYGHKTRDAKAGQGAWTFPSHGMWMELSWRLGQRMDVLRVCLKPPAHVSHLVPTLPSWGWGPGRTSVWK